MPLIYFFRGFAVALGSVHWMAQIRERYFLFTYLALDAFIL